LVNSEGTKVEGLIELNVSSEFQTVVGEAFEMQSEHSRERGRVEERTRSARTRTRAKRARIGLDGFRHEVAKGVNNSWAKAEGDGVRRLDIRWRLQARAFIDRMDRAAEHRVDESDVTNNKSIGVEATMAIEMIQHADEELVGIFVVARRERRRERLQIVDKQRGHHGHGATGENASETASRAERRQRKRGRMAVTAPRGARDCSTTLSTLGRTAKEATGTGMVASGEKG